MFDYSKSDNVISIEIPNQIANDQIDGPAVNHLESAVRESLGLRRGEHLSDFIGTVVTGLKKEATNLIVELALKDSDCTADEYLTARDNKDWSRVNQIEDEEFMFNLVVDVPPTTHYRKELENSDKTFDSEADLRSEAWKDAVEMRNKNIFNPDRTNDYLQKNNCEVIDKLIVVSDGHKGSRALTADAMRHGTDVSTVAFNQIVETPPDNNYSAS